MRKFTTILSAILLCMMAMLVATQVYAEEEDTYLLADDSPYYFTVDVYGANDELLTTVYYNTSINLDATQSTTRTLYAQESIKLVVRTQSNVSVKVVPNLCYNMDPSTVDEIFPEDVFAPRGITNMSDLVQADVISENNYVSMQYKVDDKIGYATIAFLNHTKEYFCISVHHMGMAGYMSKNLITHENAVNEVVKVECDADYPYVAFDFTSAESYRPDVLTINHHSNTGCEALSVGENYFTIEHADKIYNVVIVCPEEKAWTNPFTDVTTKDAYFNAVKYCNANGLMLGTSDTTFTPDTATTRAMVVTTLYRIAGSPAVNGKNSFSDVVEGEWYYNAVLWANANGIVLGYDDGKFGTNDEITREQFATILYRYANKMYPKMEMYVNLYPYDDKDVAEYARTPMQFAILCGILKTEDTTHLRPTDNVSRADLATGLFGYKQVADAKLGNGEFITLG